MNNPDAFIPFYGDKFFQAVKGHADHISMGYLRAIWFYWSHTHCEGLKDNSEFLRKVCEIEKDQWDEAISIIFDNDKFFVLGQDGMWHQATAAEYWKASKAKYEAAVARGKAGSEARWKGHKK